MRIALVSCVKSKRSTPAPARELYTSQLFRGFRRVAERSADRWFILSAEHGLLDPSTEIHPYERTLNNMPRSERLIWSAAVRAQLERALPAGCDVVIYAGERYREGLVEWLRERGHTVEIPLEGKGLGEQLQWLAINRFGPV